MTNGEKETLALLFKVASGLESRRPYAMGHSKRVAEMARKTAEFMKLSPRECNDIFVAGMLHDIGYLVLPDDLLQSTMPLSPQDQEMLDSQVQVGLQLIGSSLAMKDVCQIIRYHHHRFDGQYVSPDSTKASIPLGSRILQVAEAFDAMTSHRPHRMKMTIKQTLAYMKEDVGCYDPDVITAFVKTMRLEVKENYQNSHELTNFEKGVDALFYDVRLGDVEVPSVPKVIHLIELLFRDEDASIKRVSRILEMEPSLALKLVSLANSSLFYGMHPVSSVTDALVRIGLKEARDFLIIHMFKTIFDSPMMIIRNALDRWWEHSLLTAAASQSLSCPMNVPGGLGYAYLLGLLHDIGKPCLLKAFVANCNIDRYSEDQLNIVFQKIAEHQTHVGRKVLKESNFKDTFLDVVNHRKLQEEENPSQHVLLLSLGHEVAQNVLSEPEQPNGYLKEMISRYNLKLTNDDLRRAMSAALQRYQVVQTILSSVD